MQRGQGVRADECLVILQRGLRGRDGVVWFELDKLTRAKNVSRAASTWSSAYEVLQQRTARKNKFLEDRGMPS